MIREMIRTMKQAMKSRPWIRAVVVTAGIATPIAAAAQQPGQQMQSPQTAASQTAVADCARAQPQVVRTLDAAHMRLEGARQNNSPPAMRAAMDDLQGALGSLRAQLAACAALQAAVPSDPHAGHAMPTVQPAPSAAPGTPVMKPGSTTLAPGVAAPAAPGAPAPAVADPHAGHTMPKPTPAAGKPAGKPAVKAPSPKTAPAAADPHAGHAMPKPKSAPAGKPAMKPEATQPAPAAPAPAPKPAKVMDPVTGLMVDPATASKTTYQGQTYYFSSEEARKEFLQNPAKFAKKPN